MAKFNMVKTTQKKTKKKNKTKKQNEKTIIIDAIQKCSIFDENGNPNLNNKMSNANSDQFKQFFDLLFKTNKS